MDDPMSVSLRNTNQLSYNISDVIDVIKDDCDGFSTDILGAPVGGLDNALSEANYSVVSRDSNVDPEADSKRKAYVKVLEQPQPKALRFRYICEGRSAGSIPGVRSTQENKSFPSIQVIGYKGPAVTVVSCVTVDPPYRPHPHNLVGKEGCSKGVCTMTINNDAMTCAFSNIGIQCVKRRDVADALKLREEIRVDPFQTGFGHANQPQSIDLNTVRLCFQVFLEGSEKGKFTHPLKAVVSDPIYDRKATSDLIICKLSDCTSSVAGGKEIILLCDKVTKEDIHVRFYEVKDGMIEWEALGDFQAQDVHKQVAITFKTPRYKSLEVDNPVKVYIQLLRPSDQSTSEPRPFQYLPLDSDPSYVKRKIAKLGSSSNTYKIGKFFMENVGQAVYGETGMPIPTQGTGAVPRQYIQATRTIPDRIKNEPQDIPSPVSPLMTMVKSPPSHSMAQHYGGGTLYTVTSQAPSPSALYTVPNQAPSPSALYTVPNQAPSPSPIYTVTSQALSPSPLYTVPSQAQSPSGIYYAHQSPGHESLAGSMVPSPCLADPRVPSPGQQYHPGAQSPYSQDAGMGGHGGVILGNYAPSVSSPPLDSALSNLVLDMDSQKCIQQNPIELDMSNINSAELRSLLPGDFNQSMVDAHLSENLSSNLNIIDLPPNIKKLNNIDNDSVNTPITSMQNIPFEQNPDVSNSDSFNNLKTQIEYLNQ